MECYDDSYGYLGYGFGEALEVYAGAAPDLDDVSDVGTRLHADYIAARMTWHASEVRTLYVHAAVAAGALARFDTIARFIGSASRVACEAMVQAALEQGRVDVAQRILDAADVPGSHQERVRRRRAELDS